MNLKERTFAVIAEKENSRSHKWFDEKTNLIYNLVWMKGCYYVWINGAVMYLNPRANEYPAKDIPIYTEKKFEKLLDQEEEKIDEAYVINHAMSPSEIESIQEPQRFSFVYSNGDSGEIINKVGYWEFVNEWVYRGLDYLSAPKEPLSIKPAVKPPLGIMPKELHDQMRFEEVNAAIKRYYDAGLEIPLEWVKERNDYLK